LIAPVQVGGLWVLDSDSGRAAAYESLRINTSKRMTSFHDFRMPRAYPTFASREQACVLHMHAPAFFCVTQKVLFHLHLLSSLIHAMLMACMLALVCEHR
jgi:hypothetical protein